MRYPPLLLICFLAVAPGASATNESLTVDGVIDRYIVAIGGAERLAAIDNFVYRNGTYEEGEFRMDGVAAMSRGRPWFKLVGDKAAPGDFMEGYDGSAWEWFADPGVVLRTVGAASAAARHYAGVETPFLDYRRKGSTARLLGAVMLGSQRVYAVELTRRDGFVEQAYFDAETHLLVATGSAAPIHAFGDEVRQVTRMYDYRSVAGVLLPHRFVTVETPANNELSSMQWDKIEANVELPDDWFSPPQFERTPLQAFIEHLYTQRSDMHAVRWTYDEFRRAWPDVETADAVSFVGYQFLKMNQGDNAIALLQLNIADHPEHADARFELGRALGRAGRDSEAREQYRKAVSLDPQHRRAKAALQNTG